MSQCDDPAPHRWHTCWEMPAPSYWCEGRTAPAEDRPPRQIFNVMVQVVELVAAESPEQAIRTLQDRLRLQGFEPHDDVGSTNAFLSEQPQIGDIR